MTRFNFLRRLFRRPLKRGPDAQWIYISGNLYMRQGSDLVMILPGSSSFQTLEPDHIAPNGVAVKQIAYAIALIEGALAVGSIPPQRSSGIGLN
ncbi:MAG: hypothetical protein ACO3X1_16705 [Burkholderiaceae bacterium]